MDGVISNESKSWEKLDFVDNIGFETWASGLDSAYPHAVNIQSVDEQFQCENYPQRQNLDKNSGGLLFGSPPLSMSKKSFELFQQRGFDSLRFRMAGYHPGSYIT